MKPVLAIALAFSIAIPPTSASAASSIKPGAECKKLNQVATSSGVSYICLQSGKKLSWSSQAANYEMTKLKAYAQIRAGADSANLDNVELVYHISSSFPKDLRQLYTAQVEYASKLYGSLFAKKEVVNIYMYTEKDEKYLRTQPILAEFLDEHLPWFQAWRQGKDQEHNLGLAGWFKEGPPGVLAGHAGVLASSKASAKTMRKYAIQVMPHEYWHVVQDYYFRPKFEDKFQARADKSLDGLDFYTLHFPTTFREGSANTISFAMAANTKKEYLDLYRYFITELRSYSHLKLITTLTSTQSVEKALKKIEDRRTFSEAHEASYPLGSLLYEWVIAEYGFDAYKKILENQMTGDTFEDNIQASLGMSVAELYKKAAPHILAAFSGPMATAAVKPGTTCKKAGQISTSAGIKYACVKSGKKLVWNKGVTVKADPKPDIKPVEPTPTATPTPTPTATPMPTPTPTSSDPFAVYGKDAERFRAVDDYGAKIVSNRSKNAPSIISILQSPTDPAVIRMTANAQFAFSVYEPLMSLGFTPKWIVGEDGDWVKGQLKDVAPCLSWLSPNQGGAGCRLTAVWRAINVRDDDIMRETMLVQGGHEIFHLYQQELWKDKFAKLPDWLREGSASLGMGIVLTHFEDRKSFANYGAAQKVDRNPKDKTQCEVALNKWENNLDAEGFGYNNGCEYGLGLLMNEYLIMKGHTLNDVLELTKVIGNGSEFPAAFQQVYKISMAEYFKQLRVYLKTLEYGW